MEFKAAPGRPGRQAGGGAALVSLGHAQVQEADAAVHWSPCVALNHLRGPCLHPWVPGPEPGTRTHSYTKEQRECENTASVT